MWKLIGIAELARLPGNVFEIACYTGFHQSYGPIRISQTHKLYQIPVHIGNQVQ